uniref:Uncharacterized protein n=1 Tax=Timspurckia oligopyrenoides TaxID=708627 RepID=A0A7S0ZJJ8_9RHOD
MTEFTPTSKECKDALEKMYCADHSLIIKFRSDPIDESEKLENALRKRMDSADSEVKSVTMETLFGSHTSPATPDVFLKDKVPFLEECAPEWMKRVREPVRKYVLRDVDQAIDLIDEWILKRIENNEV